MADQSRSFEEWYAEVCDIAFQHNIGWFNAGDRERMRPTFDAGDTPIEALRAVGEARIR